MTTDDSILNKYLFYSVTGQLETANFPNCDYIWCKYTYLYGNEWLVISGIEDGMTQTSVKGIHNTDRNVFNFPIEISFKSSNPHGWPQIIVHAYGVDIFGNDVVRGYGACHLPLQPGRHIRKIPMFVPRSSSLVAQFIAWIYGRRPEFCNPKIVAMSESRDLVHVRTQGTVTMKFNVIMNSKNLDYDFGEGQNKCDDF